MKEIIEGIKKGYTGDTQKDTEYLLAQLEKYKDNQAVIKEIYKLLFELLPKDQQNKLVGNINREKFDERMVEIQELVEHKSYERALNYLDLTIEHIDKVYEDDKYVYKTFHNSFEAYYYASTREDKTKLVKNAEIDFGTYHKFRGIVLNNLNRYEEAEKDFLESFKWNPVDFEAVYEYANTLYGLKKYDEFYQYNIDAIKKSFTNYAIACGYHNLGLYYMLDDNKEKDFLAYCLISYSISFAETENAFRDLNTLCEKYNWRKELAKEEDVFKTLKENNISLAPDFELTKFLVDTAKKFMGVNDEFALYVFKLIYQLTHDEITKEYIKQGEQVIAAKKKAN